MSNGYWQTNRQSVLYARGMTTTQRVTAYVELWENRCYRSGIPDEAPRKLEASGRVPSYRQIAVAILNNDLKLHTLGMSDGDCPLADAIYWQNRRQREHTESGQQELHL